MSLERDGSIVVKEVEEVDHSGLIEDLAMNAIEDLNRIEGLILQLPTMSSAQVNAVMVRLKRIEDILVEYEDVEKELVKLYWLKETFNQAVNVKWSEENQPVELVELVELVD